MAEMIKKLLSDSKARKRGVATKLASNTMADPWAN
jgi:hypothetical protein